MIIKPFPEKPALTQIILTLALFIPLALAAQSRPSLLLDAAAVPELRERIEREPYASMVATLTEYAEQDTTSGIQYGESVAAMNCSFLYVLTGDDTWAAKARGYVEMRLADSSSSHGWDMNIKGLALYWHGRAVALAYDHCHDAPSWNTPADAGNPGGPAFVDAVRDALKAQADRIFTHGGTQQNTNPASNWQNNRFSSAGLIYLAIEDSLTEAERANIDACMDKVKTYLVENMGDDPDSRGYNIESIGYQMYPWSFTGPFAIAAERLGYGRLSDAAPAAAAYALWTVYAVTARIPHLWGDHFGIHPDFGDDNNNHRGEGCYGLSFYFCPGFLHPGLRYWYDRIVGELGDQTWDRERGGLMYSILYYPDDVDPVEPDSIKEWANAMLETGGNGYFSYRNRYQDNDDLIAQLYAKFQGNKGHSGPDALSFRIVGLDAPFAVGGGRYGPDIHAADTGKKQDAYLRSMNTLYPVDPENELTISGQSGALVGAPQRFPDGGGTVVLNIPVNNVNTRDHTRRFLADYSEWSGADGVYVISDTSEDGQWWQFCQVDLDAEVPAITVEGNTFTVMNPNGSSLKATVVYPEGELNWKTGTRIRGSDYGYYGVRYGENEYVHFQGADGDYLVVLTVCDAGRSHPEVASIAGEGANIGRVLQIGDLKVAIDGDAISRGAAVESPPTVAIGTPEPLVTLAPGPFDLEVAGQAFAGTNGLASIEVYYGPVSEYLGNGILDTNTGLFDFIIPALPLGHHIFRVKAVDEKGLASYSEYIPLSVHVTQPPVVRVTTPEDGSSIALSQLTAGSWAIQAEIHDPDPDGAIASAEIHANGAALPTLDHGDGTWSAAMDVSSAGQYRIEVFATDVSGEGGYDRADVHVSLGQLPPPWIHFDVGDVGSDGSVVAGGEGYTMLASGSDIWGGADEMHFAFQPFPGDGEMTVYVESQQFTDGWAKAGPMFRESARADAAYAGVFITPANGVTLQRRTAEGNSSSSTGVQGVTAPVWLRLVREGSIFTGYYRKESTDPWTIVGSYLVDLPDTTAAGMAATSHNDGVKMAVNYRSFRYQLPPRQPRVALESLETGFRAKWDGLSGNVYRLQVSTDLETWTDHGMPLPPPPTAPGTISPMWTDLEALAPPFLLRVLAE